MAEGLHQPSNGRLDRVHAGTAYRAELAVHELQTILERIGATIDITPKKTTVSWANDSSRHEAAVTLSHPDHNRAILAFAATLLWTQQVGLGAFREALDEIRARHAEVARGHETVTPGVRGEAETLAWVLSVLTGTMETG